MLAHRNRNQFMPIVAAIAIVTAGLAVLWFWLESTWIGWLIGWLASWFGLWVLAIFLALAALWVLVSWTLSRARKHKA